MASAVQKLLEDATCCICLEYFQDPATLDCGHSYCRTCLLRLCEKVEGASCPQCKEPIAVGKAFPINTSLRNLTEELLKDPTLQPLDKAGHCERHQEPLKLFCKGEETLICVVCRESRDHRSHQVLPKEEADEEYKERIQTEVKKLKSVKETLILKYSETKAHLKYLEDKKNKMLSHFSQLDQFVQEQKNIFLEKLEALQKEIEDKQISKDAKFSAERSQLESLIKKLEQLHQRSGNEFLQDIKHVLKSCTLQEKQGMPGLKKLYQEWNIQKWSTENSVFTFTQQIVELQQTVKTFKGNVRRIISRDTYKAF